MDTTDFPTASATRPGTFALDRVDWVKSIPFFSVHAVALFTVVSTPFSWHRLGFVLASYAVRMFAITAGYHRYFSHRSFRTGRAFQFSLAALGATATQKGPLWWAAHHRDHHRLSDTPGDVHSPVQRGFWWSHVGWILSRRFEATKLDRVKDLARYPELRWLDRYHVVPVVAYAAAWWAIAGLPGVLWGYFVSTVLLWHGTFLVNSLAHVVGRRRYATSDESRNSLFIAFFTFGEGWHNNHHHYPSTANQGWFWWEIDLSFYLLRALAALGIVHDLRTPPYSIVHAPAADRPARGAAEPKEPKSGRTAGQRYTLRREATSSSSICCSEARTLSVSSSTRAGSAGPSDPAFATSMGAPKRSDQRAGSGSAPSGRSGEGAGEVKNGIPSALESQPARAIGSAVSSLPTIAHGTIGTPSLSASLAKPPRPKRWIR